MCILESLIVDSISLRRFTVGSKFDITILNGGERDIGIRASPNMDGGVNRVMIYKATAAARGIGTR